MNKHASNHQFLVTSTIAIFLIMVLLISLISLSAEAELVIPKAESNFYVNDFANLFTNEQKEEMINNAVQMAEMSDGIQIVVTTIISLDGNSINDYATSMYNEYGIGKNDKGLLILLSTEDREIWVEVGYGLESTYTARKTGEFIDNFAISYLSNNQFAEGLIALQKAFINDLNKRIVSVPTKEPTAEPFITTKSTPVTQRIETLSSNSNNSFLGLYLSIASLLFVIDTIIAGYIYIKYKANKNNEGNEQYNELLSDYRKRVQENESLERDKNNLHNEYNSLKSSLRYKQTLISNLNAEVEKLQNDNKTLYSDYNSILRKYDKLETEHLTTLERFRHARSIYPNLEAEIDAHIQEEKDKHNRLMAANFDSEYQFLIDIEPSVDSALRDKAKQALTYYGNLSEDIKKYIKTDIDKIRNLLAKCNELYDKDEAEKFNKVLKTECNGITRGTEEMLGQLNSLQKRAFSYSSGIQRYIDLAIVEKLARLIKEGQAERDARLAAEEAERKRLAEIRKQEEQRRREEEERRRKQEEERKKREEEERKRRQRKEEERRRRASNSFNSTSSHSSSSFSSSHHSGFGGHSGGSGAGRGF